MKYRARITLKLPESNENDRSDFFESLKKSHWKEHPIFSSVWEKDFSIDLPADAAVDHLIDDLNFAKSLSFVQYVEYALQVNKDSILTGRLV